MRVLMIAPTPFFGDRGCHVRILEQVRALRRHGVEVLLATYHLGRDVPDVRTVRTLRLPWVRRLPVGFSVHKPGLDLLLLITAARAARRFRPDVIHGHLHEGAVLAAVLGRRLGRPAVADLQGSLTAELIDHRTIPARGPLPALVRVVERATLRAPVRLLASSASFARELALRWELGDRVVALPDGVNPEVFRSDLPAHDLRRAFGLEGRRVVVFLGVLTRYQGVDDLIGAWPRVVAAVPDAHLLLMGYPNERRYRDVVARAGLGASITITGRIDYREAPRYLALGDVAVSAKRSATEGNGKLLNYMASGLPTITYEGPVAREILGEDGIFVPMGDTTALATACVTLLEEAGERRRRGAALRERAVTEFSWSALGDRLVEVYRDAAGARRRRAPNVLPVDVFAPRKEGSVRSRSAGTSRPA
jgi:glycosyltransferase involved in cell wall biosynthesis